MSPDTSSRRGERWVAASGLAAALAALPLPSHEHSPELAAVLAIGAIAWFAGHRWALGVVVLAEIFLVAAVWPLAILARPPSVPAQIAVTIACLGAGPGLWRLRGGARDVVALAGIASERGRRFAGHGLLAGALAILASPLLG